MTIIFLTSFFIPQYSTRYQKSKLFSRSKLNLRMKLKITSQKELAHQTCGTPHEENPYHALYWWSSCTLYSFLLLWYLHLVFYCGTVCRHVIPRCLWQVFDPAQLNKHNIEWNEQKIDIAAQTILCSCARNTSITLLIIIIIIIIAFKSYILWLWT